MPSWFRRPPKVTEATALTQAQSYQIYPPPQPRRGPPVVTAATMLSLPGFYAAMRVICGQMMTLPVLDAAGEEIDVNPGTGTHLLARPTEHDTAATFLDSVMMNLLIHGNAFIVPTQVSMVTGEITRVEVIHPDYITPAWPHPTGEFPDSQTFAVGAWLDGEYLAPADFIHLKDLSLGGHSWGISRLKVLAKLVGLQASEQAHVASTYDDGAQPTGYWASSKALAPKVAEEAATEIAKIIGGRGNGIGVIGNDLKWEQVSLSHADIQMLESRQFSASQAASVMGVPPHLIGAATYDSETYSNARMDMAAFEALTLRRYMVTISQEFGLHGIMFRFGSPELAQAPETERIAAMTQAVQAGLCSAEQAADRLGWPAPETPEPADEPGVTDDAIATMMEVASSDA